MRRAILAALAIATAVPAGASAQAVHSGPRTVDPASRQTCESGNGQGVVVCGQRVGSPYRIDPATLDSLRKEDLLKHPERIAGREPPPEACGTVRNECDGGYFPIFQPLMTVVSAVVKAANGEDWREPFRTGPDEYQLYLDAKRKQGRGSIKFGVTASSGK